MRSILFLLFGAYIWRWWTGPQISILLTGSNEENRVLNKMVSGKLRAKVINYPGRTIQLRHTELADLKRDLLVSDILVLTSKNAVRAMAEYGVENVNQVIPIGQRTLDEVSIFYPEARVLYMPKRALKSDLIQSLKARPHIYGRRRLIYPTSLEADSSLENSVPSVRFNIYESIFDDSKVILTDIVIFESPSAVVQYVRQNPSFDPIALCIGSTTGLAAKPFFSRVLWPQAPSRSNMLDILSELVKALRKGADFQI